MKLTKTARRALIGLGVAAFLCVLLAILVPLVIKQQAIEWVTGHTTRTLRIETLRFNPLTLRVSARGVSFSEAGAPQTEFIGFDRLDAALSLRSIIDRAIILRKLRLEGPRLRLVRTAANRYNFEDLQQLGKEQPQPEAPQPGKPLQFSVNNIAVVAGRIDFFDQGLPVAKHHVIRDLDIGIPFIGNIPYLTDLYVTPSLSATVNDAPFRFAGKLKPFQDGAETSLDLTLDQLALTDYTPYLPTTLPLQITAGRFDSKLTISYRVSKGQQPDVVVSGHLRLADFAANDAAGQPLASMGNLSVDLLASRPLRNDFHLAQVAIDTPMLSLSRNAAGHWNLPGPTPGAAQATAEAPPPPAAATDKTPLRLCLDSLRLTGGIIGFTDQLPRGGFSTRFQQLRLSIEAFDSSAATPARLAFDFSTERKEMLTLAGTVTPQPLDAVLTLNAQHIPLADYYPYLQQQLTAPVGGLLSVQGQLRYHHASGISLQQGALQLTGLKVPFPGDDRFTLERVAASGLAGSVADNSWQLEELTLDGGRFTVTRFADGRWSPVDLLRPASRSPARAARPTERNDATPPRFTLARLRLTNWSGTVRDDTVQNRVTLGPSSFSLDQLVYPQLTVAAAALSARIDNGRLQLETAGQLAPLAVTGRLRLHALPLARFAAYVPESVRVLLVSGEASADLRFRLAHTQQRLGGSCRGSLGLGNLYLVNADDADDLLRWENLQLRGIDADFDQNRLRIGEIALSGLVSQVTIDPDGRLNFGKLVRQDTPGSVPPLPATTTAATAPPERDWQIAVDQVTLQNGRCDFTDRHMRPPFHAEMHELGGRISGLSTAPEMLASVDLRGTLENRSPLKIGGTMNPLSKSPQVDLTLSFSDIELSPVTPYSGRYLGYTIDKGKLFLDLNYRIDNRELAASNRIFIDQFTFGDTVDSSDAVNLPVKLAVALLKDNQGEIRLDVPVSGRTDDPEFSVWRIVLQVLKNLLLKAATSPLSLLAAMTGGEEFTAVEFAAGSARLSDSDRQNLARLATALNNRPSLKLQLTGYAEAAVDAEGWRREELERRLQRAKFLDLVRQRAATADQGVESVTVAPAERPRYLLEVYRQAGFPKPRTAIGLLKSLPDAEMEKLLLAHTMVGAEELHALAWARSNAVKNALMAENALPPARVFQNNVVIARPPDKPSAWRGNRVEFGVATD